MLVGILGILPEPAEGQVAELHRQLFQDYQLLQLEVMGEDQLESPRVFVGLMESSLL